MGAWSLSHWTTGEVQDYSFDVALVISWSTRVHLRGIEVFAAVSVHQVELYFILTDVAHSMLSLFLGLLIELLSRLSALPPFRIFTGYHLYRRKPADFCLACLYSITG